MKVMNYYALTDKELSEKIEQIRNWLFNNHKSERYKTAYFALTVALCAERLRTNPVDNFTQLVLDTLI